MDWETEEKIIWFLAFIGLIIVGLFIGWLLDQTVGSLIRNR